MHIALTPIACAALVVAGLLGLWRWRFPRLRQSAERLLGETVLGVGDNAWLLALLALCVVIVGASTYNPFLYNRF
jgi:hypothetical protein